MRPVSDEIVPVEEELPLAPDGRPEITPENRNPPPLSDDMERAFQYGTRRLKSERIKLGLRWWLAGDGYRAAGHRVHLAHSVICDAARRTGLRDAAGDMIKSRLSANFVELAHESSLTQLQRLRDDPDAISTRDLGVIGGIAADKVIRLEQLDQAKAAQETTMNAIEKLAMAIQSGKVEIGLTVSAPPVLDAEFAPVPDDEDEA